MFKDRYKLWAWVLAICLASQLVFHVVGPWAINGIQNLVEQRQEQIEQEKQEQATAPSEPLTEEEKEKEEQLSAYFGELIDILGTVSMYLGTVIIVFGVFNVVLAFTQDDSERVSRSVSTLVIGSLLIGMHVIMPMIFEGMIPSTQTDEAAETTTIESETPALVEGGVND